MNSFDKEIFTFGSNLAGRHGAGSALEAFQNHGAVYGRGVGHFGNSYAIPTKDRNIQVMTLADISCHVSNFLKFAERHPTWKFNIVDIGCGFAGFTAEEIAPLFKGAGENCNFLGELKELV